MLFALIFKKTPILTRKIAKENWYYIAISSGTQILWKQYDYLLKN
jgi:hypothetical protein